MERERNEPDLIELGTASTDTRGLPIADEPELSGFRVKGMLND